MISVVAMVFHHTLEDFTLAFIAKWLTNYSWDVILTLLDFNIFFSLHLFTFLFSSFLWNKIQNRVCEIEVIVGPLELSEEFICLSGFR